MWAALLVLQVWLGLTLAPEQYQTVAAPLAGTTTLITGAIGAIAVYYWTRKAD